MDVMNGSTFSVSVALQNCTRITVVHLVLSYEPNQLFA